MVESWCLICLSARDRNISSDIMSWHRSLTLYQLLANVAETIICRDIEVLVRYAKVMAI